MKKAILAILFVIVIACTGALNAGFFDKKVSMSFIKVPDGFLMIGNQDDSKVAKLQDKLAKLQQKAGSQTEQTEIANELQKIAVKDTVRSYDKKVMDRFVGDIKKLNGVIIKDIMRPKSGRIYAMQFGYNVQLGQDTVQNIKLGYIPNIYVFPNDTVLLPVYDEKSPNAISAVQVRLNEDTIAYLDKFYTDQVKAQ